MPREFGRPDGAFDEMRKYWPFMTVYERFEQIVAFILSLVIAAISVIALFQLLGRLLPLLPGGALDHEVFQTLFGMIMTLLIAMEFKHSIIRVALRNHSITRIKTVTLIALLALSRKTRRTRHHRNQSCHDWIFSRRDARAGHRLLAVAGRRRQARRGLKASGTGQHLAQKNP